MAKLTKSALKSIVKECLVEILSEGIGENTTKNITEGKINTKRTANRKRAIDIENMRLEQQRKKLDQRKVENVVSSITDDPIMQSVLADTAKTTLQEQSRHDMRPGSQPAAGMATEQSSAGISLDGIFNSAQNNWSHLAFAEKKTN
jgi:hypothetical protein